MTKWLWLTLLILPLCMMQTASAQPDSLWTHMYGRAGNAYGTSVLQMAGGGYLMAGHIRGTGTTWDFWVVKTNAGGDSTGSRHCAPGMYGSGGYLCPTQDGGYAMTGGYYINMNDQMYLLRMNAQADTLWSRHIALGGGRETHSDAITETIDGGFLLAGHDAIAYITRWMVLVKTRANGDTAWSRTWPGSGTDAFMSVHQTPDSGFILSGQTSVSGAGGEDFWLVKTDSLGTIQWQQTYGGNAADLYASAEPTPDGGYILAGTTQSFGAGGEDIYLVKTNSAGTSLWSRTYGGSGVDRCRSVEVLPDGGFAVAAGGADVRLLRTNSVGDSLWSRTFRTTATDWCGDVIQTDDGGYALMGTNGGTPQAMMLIKTGHDPLLDAQPYFKIWPSAFALSNFPNPFNAVTEILFDLPKAGDVSLKVFDLLGREVRLVQKGVMPAGNHRLLFDGNTLASGTYVLRLEAAGTAQSRKMLLLK